MGSCWNTPLPPEGGHIRRRVGNYGVSPYMPQAISIKTANPGSAFSREESKLRDLFTALRTGLLFSPTEFSVLPGIATTARIRFTLGNTELQKLADVDDDDDDEDFPEAVEISEEDEDSETEEDTQETAKDLFTFQITLKGKSWANDLTMRIIVWPVLGPFANRKLVFLWSGDTLRVEGCKTDELNARSLPVSFENETEFCKCCLLLLYQTSQATRMQEEGLDTIPSADVDANDTVATLKGLAYKSAVCNLDLIPDLYAIPSRIYHEFFGSLTPVVLAVKLWPGSLANQFRANTTMRVKSHILFSEFLYLLREHFGLPANHLVKLYHNFKLVPMTDLVTEKYRQLDCFVISNEDNSQGEFSGSYTSLDEVPYVSEVMLVGSLVGKSMQNIEADLEMSMKDFDILLRNQFSLKADSFLVIISEDDFSPMYTADDNWKCTYPFNVPDNSFTAGLRRSFKKLTVWRAGASRLTQSQRFQRSPSSFETNSTLAPHMSEVVKLLSSSDRHFPSNSDRYCLSLKELYTSMPLYKMNISQCGIHPYSIVQIFEVTGPSIPITVRLLSDYKQGDQLRQQSSTCLANIMDINPAWSINTFLQYVDAIISPGTGSRRKRLSLGENFLEETSSEDLSKLTIGQLLASWAPAWWPLEGTRRAQLTSRDIDPAEFLLIEKY